VDNYRAGYMAGRALGEWIEVHWESRIDRLIALIEPRAGSLPASRIQGQIEGLQSAIGGIPAEQQLFLDCGNTSEESENQMAAALKRLPGLHRIAVVSFNDDAAIGALAAARRLNREADITIVGQGADRRVRAEIRQPGTRIIGSTAYWPEHYGEKLLNAALRILNGEAVPPALFMEHIFIHPGNIQQYYPEFGPEKIASQTPEGGNS
jgi:ribose transport system substrate-binding protein